MNVAAKKKVVATTKRRIYELYALTVDDAFVCDTWADVEFPFVFHTKADAKASKMDPKEKVVKVRVTFVVEDGKKDCGQR